MNRVFINILVFTSIVLVGPVSTFAREEGADLTMSLHQAIVNGDVNEVKSILSKGVDINAKNRRSWTPLHTAIDSKQNEIVQLLLDKNADVNLADNNGETSIHLAVKSGQKDIVELLIAKGADLNIVNTHSENALSLAKKAGHKEITELLIKHGAKEIEFQENAALWKEQAHLMKVKGGFSVNRDRCSHNKNPRETYLPMPMI